MKRALPCEVCMVEVPKGGVWGEGRGDQEFAFCDGDRLRQIGGVSEGESRRRSWLSRTQDAMHQMREGIDDFIGDVGMNTGLRDGVISELRGAWLRLIGHY